MFGLLCNRDVKMDIESRDDEKLVGKRTLVSKQNVESTVFKNKPEGVNGST